MTKYDAIIIGSGQAANPLAKRLAAANWKVALIERRWVGGTCVNDGCTPTKTLIASGRVAYLMKRSADFGVHTNGFSVNIEEVLQRKNSLVLASRESSTQSLLATPHLHLLFGNAAFTGPKEVTVTQEDGSADTLTAEKIFINTGTRPAIPPIPGLAEVHYLTSTSIMELMEIPSHLMIIGGSYIALEFGQLYRRLGSEVTIIENSEQFLPKEDEDISLEIKKILQEDGIRILANTKVTRVASAGKNVRLDIETGPAPGSIDGSHVLVAAGREPDTAGLHTGAAGIGLDKKGFISVDEKLQTNIPGIYALGDIKGGPQFTHISYDDYRVVSKNLLDNANESIKNRITVYCMFTDPELGRVGMTEKQAREKGIPIKIAAIPVTKIARAFENGETRGLVKVIVHSEDKKILGAAVLSPNGGELMSILQMAMMGGVTYDRIRDTVFAHPTFAESLNNLFSKLDN
jgi:pyruvate/2-oxoglutarate dehydrogenase complex dihydrolipoamide dehydrogenase (E3) component